MCSMGLFAFLLTFPFLYREEYHGAEEPTRSYVGPVNLNYLWFPVGLLNDSVPFLKAL